MLGTLNQNLARAEKQISDWNHHFLQLFCDTLPDEVADQVRHTFLELVYPPVHPDPSSVANFAQGLSDELGEDDMAALLDLLAVNKKQRASINESLRRQFMHWRVEFTQTRSCRLDI